MNTDILSQAQESFVSVLTPSIVWIFFACIVGITVLISLIIIWHWTMHGKGIVRKAGTEIVYVAITLGIIVVLFTLTAKLASSL